MAIKFFNIRSKEIRVAESEPLIAALFNSSDRSPNALFGQDFGWRVAPEVVVELKRIKRNPDILQRISLASQRAVEDIGDTDILKWISDHTKSDEAPVALEGDFEDEYHSEIKQLERLSQKQDEPEDDEDIEIEDIVEKPAKPATGKSK